VNLAGRYDIICDQGSTLERTFIYLDADKNPINNTGWTARMQVRPTFRSDLVYLDLSSADGDITLDGVNGKIQLEADAGSMENIKAGNHVYDLEITTPTEVFKIVRGNFIVRPEVTQ
jgi:hypothetical protein